MFGLEKIWKQIEAERKDISKQRSEEDYLIRGESNQILRWGFAMVALLAHVARIFYFTQGYFLLTFLLGWYFIERLSKYLFPKFDPVLSASDHKYKKSPPSGKNPDRESRISGLFRHKLSSNDFDSLVNRILEFKLWFIAIRLILLALLLTWLPILKCSSYGPKILLLWIVTALARIIYPAIQGDD